MFNITTVVFDGPSPPFISQTLWDGTPQVLCVVFVKTYSFAKGNIATQT